MGFIQSSGDDLLEDRIKWVKNLPSSKLTWLVGKWTRIEDVYPIKNGRYFLAMLVYQRV